MIDIHCHLLPGIDDGPSDMKDTLAMLRMAAEDGTRCLVATPHYGGRFGEPSPDMIRTLVARVNECAQEAQIPLTVLPGNEVKIQLDLPNKVQAGQVLTLGDTGRYLLLEVETNPLPLYALEVHFQLRTQGITPILAHGERLALDRKGMAFVRQFAEQEGLIQVNADSIGGQAGWRMRRLCRKLIKDGLVHAIASDGHSADWRPPLLSPCLRGFRKAEREQVPARYCNLELNAPKPI